jgi:hypothetical protein
VKSPSHITGGLLSRSLPPDDDDDPMALDDVTRGRAEGTQLGEPDDGDHDAAAPHMTADERVECIYRDLEAVSPIVRRSMLVYNCVSSTYTQLDPDTRQSVTRRVLWMTLVHPFFPVVKELTERHHPLGLIHRSSMAGMPMRGVDADVMDVVAGFIWEQFLACPEKYPVYNEDGTQVSPIGATPAVASVTVAVVADPSEEEAIPILIGADQHEHLYKDAPALPPPSTNEHPKNE